MALPRRERDVCPARHLSGLRSCQQRGRRRVPSPAAESMRFRRLESTPSILLLPPAPCSDALPAQVSGGPERDVGSTGRPPLHQDNCLSSPAPTGQRLPPDFAQKWRDQAGCPIGPVHDPCPPCLRHARRPTSPTRLQGPPANRLHRAASGAHYDQVTRPNQGAQPGRSRPIFQGSAPQNPDRPTAGGRRRELVVSSSPQRCDQCLAQAR